MARARKYPTRTSTRTPVRAPRRALGPNEAGAVRFNEVVGAGFASVVVSLGDEEVIALSTTEIEQNDLGLVAIPAGPNRFVLLVQDGAGFEYGVGTLVLESMSGDEAHDLARSRRR